MDTVIFTDANGRIGSIREWGENGEGEGEEEYWPIGEWGAKEEMNKENTNGTRRSKRAG